ncbi:MAG TPA: A24 family peptidase [Chloroflexota bacterium]|nr:A24 family peptidase [Chloroflexota bacterium]
MIELLKSHAIDTVLVAGLLYAVFTDLRARRISNKLTYPTMLFGLVANTALYGWEGFGHAWMGWGVGLGVMLIPFLLRAMGAGDVKLVAAIGAVKGPEFVLLAALYACVTGGLLAIFYLYRERRVTNTFKYLAFGWLWALKGNGPKAGAIPYAPAIAAGVVLALVPYSLVSF